MAGYRWTMIRERDSKPTNVDQEGRPTGVVTSTIELKGFIGEVSTTERERAAHLGMDIVAAARFQAGADVVHTDRIRFDASLNHRAPAQLTGTYRVMTVKAQRAHVRVQLARELLPDSVED